MDKPMLDRYGFDKKKLIAHNLKNKKVRGYYFIIFGIDRYTSIWRRPVTSPRNTLYMLYIYIE